MRSQRMLQVLAGRYAVMDGPMRRQLDAQTLLNMATHLDEEGARIYLERFVAKWRLDLQEDVMASAPLDVGTLECIAQHDTARRSAVSSLVRRRPMTELERRVQEELMEVASPPSVLITLEGEDGEVRAI